MTNYMIKTALSRCCFYITHFYERKIIMEDEKNTTSVEVEPTENTAQTEPEDTTTQSDAQNGIAEKVVTQSEPQSEAKSESEHSERSGSGTVDGEKSESSEENSKQKIAVLEGKVHALSVGVAADCIDDVLALAQAKVSDEVTLEQAIDNVIEKYPNFKGNKDKEIITTSVPTANDEQLAAEQEQAKKIMGIK